MENSARWRGHTARSPSTQPPEMSPPSCVQMSSMAKYSPPRLNTATSEPLSKRPNTQRNYLNALADFLTKGGDRFAYIKDVRERIASCLRESRLQPWLVSKNDV